VNTKFSCRRDFWLPKNCHRHPKSATRPISPFSEGTLLPCVRFLEMNHANDLWISDGEGFSLAVAVQGLRRIRSAKHILSPFHKLLRQQYGFLCSRIQAALAPGAGKRSPDKGNHSDFFATFFAGRGGKSKPIFAVSVSKVRWASNFLFVRLETKPLSKSVLPSEMSFSA
jgi:hypothetical protein